MLYNNGVITKGTTNMKNKELLFISVSDRAISNRVFSSISGGIWISVYP